MDGLCYCLSFLAFLLTMFKGVLQCKWDRLNVRNSAGIAIGHGRPATLKILGLKKISSLQGLAGEVLTICKGQGQQSDRSAPPRGRSLLSNAMAVELGVSKGAKGMVE